MTTDTITISHQEVLETYDAADKPDGLLFMYIELVKALEKDAGRYRYLRSRNLETIAEGGIFAGKTPENIVVNEEDLDVEVDIAMSFERCGKINL